MKKFSGTGKEGKPTSRFTFSRTRAKKGASEKPTPSSPGVATKGWQNPSTLRRSPPKIPPRTSSNKQTKFRRGGSNPQTARIKTEGVTLGRASRTPLIERDPLKPYRENIQQSPNRLRQSFLALCQKPAWYPQAIADIRLYISRLRDIDKSNSERSTEIPEEDDVENSSTQDNHTLVDASLVAVETELLPKCLPVCDLFSKAQLAEILSSDVLDQESECLAPLVGLVNLLVAKAKHIAGKHPHIAKILLRMHQQYANDLNDLCAKPELRKEIVRQTAYIALGSIASGDNEETLFFEIDPTITIPVPDYKEPIPLANFLICLHPVNANQIKTNKGGQRAVAFYNDIVFKADPYTGEPIQPEVEEASASHARSFDPNLASSAAWVKFLHVPVSIIDEVDETKFQKFDQRKFGGLIVQYGENQYVERLTQISELKKGITDDKINLAHDYVVEWEERLGEKLVPTMEAWQLDNVPNLVENLLREFPQLETIKDVTVGIDSRAIILADVYGAWLKTLDESLWPQEAKKIIHGEEQRHRAVIRLFGHCTPDEIIAHLACFRIAPEVIQGCPLGDCHQLLDVMKTIRFLFPNPADGVRTWIHEIKNIYDRFDHANTSMHAVADLSINHKDKKSDNILDEVERDEDGNADILRKVTIDGDEAFIHETTGLPGKHYNAVENVDFLKPTAIKPFDSEAREDLTKQKPIFRFLAWLVERVKSEGITRNNQKQGTLRESDYLEGGKIRVQIPKRYHPATLPRMFATMQKEYDILSGDEATTPFGLFEQIQPANAGLYWHHALEDNDANRHCVTKAYKRVIHFAPKLEDCLPDVLPGLPDGETTQSYLNKISCGGTDFEKNRILNLFDAINTFFNGYQAPEIDAPFVHEDYNHPFSFEGYTPEEKLQILEVIGTHLPFISQLNTLKDVKERLLLEAAKNALPGAIKVLLRLGAKINAKDANGLGVLHYLLMRPINDEEHLQQILETLDVLLSKSVFDPFSVDHRGLTGLMHLIKNAKSHQTELVERIIEKLQSLAIFDINQRTEKGTALDLVMALKPARPALFVTLVRNGAGRLVNVQRALAYTKEHADYPGMKDTVTMLAQPDLNSEFYYVCAIDAMTIETSGIRQDLVALKRMDGEYLYLHPDVAEQIFDKNRHVRPVVDAGRRNVAPVEFNGFKVHVKENPEVHANQEIAGIVRRQFGSYDITPFGEVFLVVDRKGVTFSVMFTVTTLGESYKNDATNKQARPLSTREATEVLLTDGIIVPEDFNANNATKDARDRLFVFDEDHCLIADRGAEKSIMYCQRDKLDEPLDPIAVTRFCMRDLASEMRIIGGQIGQRDKYCREVLDESTIKKIGKLRVREAFRNLKEYTKTAVGIDAKPLLGFFSDKEMLVNMYLRMVFIQRALQSNPTMTWGTYIQVVVPEANRILHACRNPKNATPKEVYDDLWGDDYYHLRREDATKTNTKSLARLSALPEDITHNPKSRKKYSIVYALRRLQEELQGKDIVETARGQLVQGNTSGLNTCPLTFRGEVIYGFDFSKMKHKPLDVQQSFLERLIKEPFPVTEIKLINFNGQHVSGIDKNLKGMFTQALFALINKSPDLVRLQLINCAGVNAELVRSLANKCKKLQHLNLTGSVELEEVVDRALMGGEKALEFKTLVYLRLNGSGVKRVQIYAPNLTRLHVGQCELLASLPWVMKDLGDCNLRVLDIADSSNIPAEDIEVILNVSPKLESLVHRGNQPFNARNFGLFAIQNNRVNRATLVGLIQYNNTETHQRFGTLRFYGLDFTDEHLRLFGNILERENRIPEYQKPIRVHQLVAGGSFKFTTNGLMRFIASAMPALEEVDVFTQWRARNDEPEILETAAQPSIVGVQADGTVTIVSNDGTYQDWDIEKRVVIRESNQHKGSVTTEYRSYDSLPDGRMVFSTVDPIDRSKKTVTVYDPVSQTNTAVSSITSSSSVHVVGYQWLAVHDGDRLEILRINGTKVEPHLLFEDTKVGSMVSTRDGHLLTCFNHDLSRWCLEEPACEETINFGSGDSQESSSMHTLKSGDILWDMSGSNKLVVVNPDTYQVVVEGELAANNGHKCFIDLPNDEVMVGSENGPVVICNQDLEAVCTLSGTADMDAGYQGAGSKAKQLVVTPNGHLLVNADAIELWYADSAKLDLKFYKHLPHNIQITQREEDQIRIKCPEIETNEASLAWESLGEFLTELLPNSNVRVGQQEITIENSSVSLLVLSKFVKSATPSFNNIRLRRSSSHIHHTGLPFGQYDTSSAPEVHDDAEPTEVPRDMALYN